MNFLPTGTGRRGYTRGGRPGDPNAWETFEAELPPIVARLAPIRLTCRDALESIRAADDHGPEVVHYPTSTPPGPTGGPMPAR